MQIATDVIRESRDADPDYLIDATLFGCRAAKLEIDRGTAVAALAVAQTLKRS